MAGCEIKMDTQLWELSTEHAQEVLHEFLKVERDAFRSIKVDSIELDYSQESVIRAAHHIASEIEAGLLGEEEQNLWFTRLGFYLGEALCRTNRGLSWGLGDSKFAFANHPVVAGFAGDEEAPTITICRNMIQSVVEGLSPPTRIDNGVKNWFEKAVASHS
jgi:hypothetical protein